MIKKYHNLNKEKIMPLIRPISDLRNHANEISDLCHGADEPVFITKNGQGDLVMSLAHYERLHNLLDLYQKLGEAEAIDAAGDKGITHREMMTRLKQNIK
jgi:PHD/YefM family antitoxin component YafN of YafNO toxin-antitoxin module